MVAVVPLMIGAFVLAANAPSLGASRPPDVCRIVGKNDIFRVLGWNVEHVRKRPYRFGTFAGKMCNYESSQGIVTTIMPDAGSPFPGISADNTADSAELVETVPGLGAQVQLFNGTVYVTRGRRRVEVRVVPETRPASYADITPFAKVIVTNFR